MTYPQDFNSKYAHLLVYDGKLYTRAHDIPTRSKYGEWAEVPQHTPDELFNHLRSFYHAQLGHDNFTHYLSELEYIDNPAELSADFHRVRRYENAYLQSRDKNAAKSYPATIPPPPAKVRKQFVSLSALKAQPENSKDLNHQREHALINSLIETLHECTQISHSINHPGDLDIKYTRQNGTTGEAYLPHYNSDYYTPLFRNTLNNILSSCTSHLKA